MSLEITDYFDMTYKTVATVGGIIAAFKIVIELRENRKQRAQELRWKQSNTARELINSMFADKYAEDACTMIDWQNRKYEIVPSIFESIDIDDIRQALRIINLNFIPKEVYIRDCMDSFLFHIEMIEQAIENRLIEFKDVEFPFYYYYNCFSKGNLLDSITKYIDAYKFENSKSFMARIAILKEVKMKTGLNS